MFGIKNLSGFQKLAIATTIMTYILIMVGGFVRAAGAGLGCPDWPKCFGYWIPPASADMIVAQGFPAQGFNPTLMWIEYANRLVGVLIGFLILLTSVVAIRYYRSNRRVLWSSIAAFICVLFNGYLGKVVVDSELHGLTVTIHFMLALAIVALLLYATVCAFFPNGKPLGFVSTQRWLVARLTQAVLGLSLLQFILGTTVRGHIDDVVSKTTLPRSEWVAQVGVVDQLHRIGALVLTAAVFALVLFIVRDRQLHPALRRVAWLAGALVLIQVGAGLGLAYGGLPPVLQLVHVICGSLLIGALTLLILLAYRLPTNDQPEQQPARQLASI